ncbi:MAG: PLD nuclease N-terminal domain-containing protein [Coriobacteriia bacterium]|nr:PLD nuclease N-terminal domain-containing protein [Coriobacteriia bacterium]
MQSSIPIEGLPTWVLVAGGMLAIAQISFELWALVHMLRQPSERLNLGGRKWLWAIIILFVNFLGAIIYFAAGRKPAEAIDTVAATPTQQRATAAVDSLYGSSEDAEPR